uniref:AmmeMemoRadiSam system protein A n=1 Tax=Desulforadius tongensis TaxID=1216062 RepID=UPI003084379A
MHCGVVPHPPVAVPEVGKREADKVSDTRQALLELGRRIKDSGAGVLVMISPHSPVFADAIVINMAEKLRGDLAAFGAPGVTFECDNDSRLANEIIAQCEKLNLVSAALDERLAGEFNVQLSLDHGITVPLYFLRQAGLELPLVVSSMSMFSFEQLYRFGIAVARASETLHRRVALLASGDLSHRLTPGAPAGYEPEAFKFDEEIVRLVGSADALSLINLDPDMVEKAGECGLRPIIMMMGALDGKSVQPEVLSYQAPFGVGYMVASLQPGGDDDGRLLLQPMEKNRREKLKARREKESFLVKLARETLENYVLGKPKPEIKSEEIPPEFKRRAAVFVSIKKNGQLRGCIGSVYPQQEDLVQEVMHNAINAGIHDPRFYPVRPEELDELTYSVDVLTEPEPVSGLEQLDPKKYGVIVRKGNKSGLLLPDLEGIDTAREQVDIAKEKAGIGRHEDAALERFEVVRYK